MISDWIVFFIFLLIIIAAVIGIFLQRKKGNRVNYTIEKDNALDDLMNFPD